MMIFQTFTPASTLLPNLLVSSALSNGVFGLAIIYSELRNSVIMKKIRATPLPQWKVVGGIISFNVFISLLANCWIFGVGAFFYRSDIIFSQINWFYLILAVFLATLLGSLFGFLIGSVAPNIQAAGNFAFFINMPSAFLSGIYVPMRQLLKNNNLALVAKFIPYSYPVNIANRAFSHYNLDSVKDNLLFANYHLPIIFSLLWIFGLFGLVLFVYRVRKE